MAVVTEVRSPGHGVQAPRRVVACVVQHEGRLLLLKRSQEVGSDRGRWHCVTGFCDLGTEPLEQAWQELEEETGLSRRAAYLRGRATPLELMGGRGEVWTVHAFLFGTSDPEVTLNWEHDAARWADGSMLDRLDTVPWLDDIHECFGSVADVPAK